MPNIDTLALHAGEAPDPETGALRVPIQMAASFRLPRFGQRLFDALLLEGDRPPHAYSRWSNPTLTALEERLAALEGFDARRGGRRDVRPVAALATATGMAAISALLLTYLRQGDHIVASEVCYAGAVELLGEYLPRLGIGVSLVDTSDLDQVRAALRPETRLVYVETPANPILRLADIAALADLAHRAGALLAVDSTFAGPTIQRPLALGADYVVHSLTKYLNGHGDALGGAIIGPAQGIRRIRKEMLIHLGGAMSPFNAWLILRGLATLPLRMARHSANALAVARFLEAHPRVTRVVYPGLESHPHHDLARRQMSAGGEPAYGGMLTFQLKGGLGAAITLAEKIRLFQYATSLGHAHSLLFYYPTDLYVDAVSYLDAAQKARIRAWMGDGIVRTSIGLEDPADLIADLDQALRARTLKGMLGPLAYKLLS
ncbi:MAG: aminotransferase class I/II-fold pyridoxal phosphate-dependent enzyme [Anaerolineae bacterium]|nr:aminotransferase class I/II-fold pyridoxal phosphate-dependent enzyme [Anaerolineae bacterium]